MDLRQLEYFVHVADARSFSKAAQILSIAQPALSRQVRRLEVELRTSLFLRNGRGVALTDSGRLLLEHARGILRQVERAREELDESRGTPRGRVVIGVPPSVARLLAAPLVAHFRERFPAASIGIVEGLSVHILEWLDLGRIDAGLVFNPQPAPNVALRSLHEQDLCLIGRGNGDEAGTVAFRDLPRHPLIIPSRPHAIRMLVESRLAAAQLAANIALEIDGVGSILDLVAQGAGYAVLPRQALSEAREPGRLRLRRIVRPTLRVSLSIATPARRPSTALAGRAVSLLEEIGPELLRRGG